MTPSVPSAPRNSRPGPDPPHAGIHLARPIGKDAQTGQLVSHIRDILFRVFLSYAQIDQQAMRDLTHAVVVHRDGRLPDSLQ